MNKTCSLHEKSQTGKLDGNLVLRQYEFDLMAKFKEIKSLKPRLTQKEKLKNLEIQLLVYNVIDMI